MPFEAIGKQLQGNWEDNSKAIGERLERGMLFKCIWKAIGMWLEAFENQFECDWNAVGKQLECIWIAIEKQCEYNWKLIGKRLGNN